MWLFVDVVCYEMCDWWVGFFNEFDVLFLFVMFIFVLFYYNKDYDWLGCIIDVDGVL